MPLRDNLGDKQVFVMPRRGDGGGGVLETVRDGNMKEIKEFHEGSAFLVK